MKHSFYRLPLRCILHSVVMRKIVAFELSVTLSEVAKFLHRPKDTTIDLFHAELSFLNICEEVHVLHVSYAIPCVKEDS